MSDWQVGDLAVCVDDSPCRCGAPCRHPQNHAIQMVAGRTYTVNHWIVFQGKLYLTLAGVKIISHWGVHGRADRFRKIRPDEHEACEEEFVTLLNRTKRTVRA